VTQCICDESVNASDDGDLARCVCGDYDDRLPDTTLSIDDPRRALESSNETTGA
jgi:hypothetical protein